MKGKDFLSIADLTPDEVSELVEKAARLKSGEAARPLDGKIFALLFEKPSLRTRVSFEVGVRQLGGDCVYLSRDDVGLGVREPEADVARVLDRWVDGIVAPRVLPSQPGAPGQAHVHPGRQRPLRR